MNFGMNKKLFKQLCMNYNREADKELYELWEYNLRPYDDEELQKAVSIIISQDKYFPTLNRVLEIVKNIVSKEVFVKDTTKYKNTEWYGKKITNQEIDEETEKEYQDFLKYLEEFRNG